MKPAKREKVFRKFDGHCAYCGHPIDAATFTVDHVIPQSKGGTGRIENLLPCCHQCNQLKAAESIEMLRIELFWHKIWPKMTLENIKDFSNIRKKAAAYKFYFEKPKKPRKKATKKEKDPKRVLK